MVCLLQGQGGRTALVGFFQGQGGAAVQKIDFRLFFFWVLFLLSTVPPKFFSPCKFLPSLCVHCSLVFIGKVLLGFQTSPSTFPFLFFSSFFL